MVLGGQCVWGGGAGAHTLTPAPQIVSEMSDSLRSALLRFTTSCSRPPLLGFARLSPKMCIQRVHVTRNDEKLPSAATCMNILKLPDYSNKLDMYTALVTSITSGAGFELT